MDDLIEFPARPFEVKLPGPELETAEFALEGLISGPHVQKLNRNSIFLFVNGRLIRDRVLLHALSAAYYNLMPPGCYPFALLFLNCDPGEVDVNVHPSKTEVRFRHGSAVHDLVRDAVREMLMESRPVSKIPMPASPVAQRRVEPVMQQAAALPFSEFSAISELDEPPVSVLEIESRGGELPVVSILPTVAPVLSWLVPHAPAPPGPGGTTLRRIPDTHGALDGLPADWERVDSLGALVDLRPLGQLHDSFIVAAGRDGLWIVDQHVAHERILFEQVLRQRAAGTVEIQQLLMPIVLQLTAGQEFEYARIADELNAYGFETEPFGQRTIAIKSSPAGVGAGDIEKIVFEILEIAESEFRSASLDEIRRSVCATIACRAAIKINMRLEQTKIDWLLRALAACEYPMTCPHGRPIALRYSTKDILKSFHRI
jgi:DNA mismatch repair protein MutL